MACNLPGLEPLGALPLADRARERLHLAQRDRPGRPRSPRRRRLRPLARPGRPRLAPGLGRLRDLPRPLCGEWKRLRPARLGGSSRLGRAADRARPRHPARVVRRRPRRDRAAPGSHRAPRRIRPLPDADLPRREHPPLRRGELRGGRSAPRGRPRPRLARGRRPRARPPHRGRPDAEPLRRLAPVVPEGAGRSRGGRACLLHVRRAAAERLRGMVGVSRACPSSTGARPSWNGGCSTWSATGSRRPSRSTAGGSTSPT